MTDVACDACCMPPPWSICRFNTGCFMLWAVFIDRVKWAPDRPERTRHAGGSQTLMLRAFGCYSRRNGAMASKVVPGNSSCMESFPRANTTLRMPETAASASISARDLGGVSAP